MVDSIFEAGQNGAAGKWKKLDASENARENQASSITNLP